MQLSPSQHEVPALNKLRGLISVQKPIVMFDPSDSEHREAYRMLAQDGRQHPTLRFVLEYPFQDILTYMERRLSLYAVKELKAAA
jgi:hypothetical protein